MTALCSGKICTIFPEKGAPNFWKACTIALEYSEGKAYTGKSLPVIIKNYKETRTKSVVIYSGQYFGIFPFLEFIQLYAECTLEVRQLLDPILAKV